MRQPSDEGGLFCGGRGVLPFFIGSLKNLSAKSISYFNGVMKMRRCPDNYMLAPVSQLRYYYSQNGLTGVFYG